MNHRIVQKAVPAWLITILLIILLVPLCFHQRALAAPAQDSAQPAAVALKLVHAAVI